MDSGEGVCVGMHRVDGRRSGEQRRAGIPEASGSGGAGNVDGDYRDPDCVAGRDCAGGDVLRDHGDGSGRGGVPEPPVVGNGGGGGQGNLLRPHDVLGTVGAVPVGKYFVCGFSAAVPDGSAGRLSSPFVDGTRAAARIFTGDLGAGNFGGATADFVWRRYRPVDSVICGGRVPGFYFVAGRDGGALAQEREGVWRGAWHGGEWNWRARYRAHAVSNCRGKVCGRSMGGSAPASGGADFHGQGAAAL